MFYPREFYRCSLKTQLPYFLGYLMYAVVVDYIDYLVGVAFTYSPVAKHGGILHC